MSWLGTVSIGDGYIKSTGQISRTITLYTGTGGTGGVLVPSVSEAVQHADTTTWYWGGMNETAASAWVGTLKNSTAPEYTDIAADRVDDSGQYAVSAQVIGTWA